MITAYLIGLSPSEVFCIFIAGAFLFGIPALSYFVQHRTLEKEDEEDKEDK
ncbi:MAG: hypothetical protein KAS39_05580 [Actinomycetia bacterium]|nr:hypothetical protein [Actinomycetes bacterium]